MIKNMIVAIFTGLFSMIILDPYFIYGYFKNKRRKKNAEPYRDYRLLLKKDKFWILQILFGLMGGIFSSLICMEFSNLIFIHTIFSLFILNMMYVLNVMVCIFNTPIARVFNFAKSITARMITGFLILIISLGMS